MSSIRISTIIELVFAAIAIMVSIQFLGADDYADLLPLYAIGLVAAFVLFILIFRISRLIKDGELTAFKKIIILVSLVAFSLPLLFILRNDMGTIYLVMFIVYLLILGVYIISGYRFSDQRKIINVLLLAFIPLIAITYYFDYNNTAPAFWLLTSLVIFSISVSRAIR